MEWICPPLLMSKYTLTTRHHWFTCVHLQISHLTQSCCAFSVTLTTLTLNQRSSQWFGGRFQKPPPEGPPPSQLQLRADRLCSRGTPEPYVNLSAHTALLIQPMTHTQYASVPLTSEPFWQLCSNIAQHAFSDPSISCTYP